jgi:hypothetical protein
MVVQGESEQKVREIPISINKPDVVVHTGDSSYMGDCK